MPEGARARRDEAVQSYRQDGAYLLHAMLQNLSGVLARTMRAPFFHEQRRNMILRTKTEFAEDLGIWLRRGPKYVEPRRLPKCMGRNNRGDKWVGYQSYYNLALRDRRNRIEWLWCKIHDPVRSCFDIHHPTLK